MNITIYDPWANKEQVMHEYNLESTQELPTSKFDAIVLTVAHTSLTQVVERKVLEKASLLTSLKVQLKNIVDPTIKGGFILRVGDLQYNASVLDRLERLKRELITS